MFKIAVVGWPRSGTSWLERLISHYLDGPGVVPWTQHHHPDPHPRVSKVHQMNATEIEDIISSGGKIIFIARDPRDIAVSEYFFLHGREYSVTDASLYDYLHTVFTTARGGWKEYTQKWLEIASENDSVAMTFHEILWGYRKEELEGILQDIGIEPNLSWIQHAANVSRTFDGTRPAYSRTQDWRDENLPALSGLPGEWRKHFTWKEACFLEGYCGDLIKRLGYGIGYRDGESWTELLSR